MIALKQTCVFLRMALHLPGCLVSVGAAFFLSGLKAPLCDVTAACCHFSCLKKKGDFASGSHVFFWG